MTQDEILVNDMFKRNWLPELQQPKNKVIELIVGEGTYHLHCKQHTITPFDTNKKILNPKEKYKLFLEWYKKNNLWCPVILDGCTDIYELSFFTCGAHQLYSLNIPIDLKLYWEYKDLPIWDMPKCCFYLYSNVAEKNINWSEINLPFTLYFSNGARALDVLNQFSDEQFFKVKWKFVPPTDMNDEEIDDLMRFMETIIARARKVYNETEFRNWVSGSVSHESFSPFCFGTQEARGNTNSLPCYFHQKLTISLFDMGFYLCPGLYNPEFHMGNINFDDNPTITNVNAPLWIFKDHIRQNVCIGCDTCEANKVCRFPCLAKGYEDTLLLGCISGNLPLHEKLRACYAKIIHLLTYEEWERIFSQYPVKTYKDYIIWLGEHTDVREYSKY